MGRRFSRYNFALKANNGQAQAGSALGRYQDFATGASKPTYTRNASSNPEELQSVIVESFLDIGQLFIVPISKRAKDAADTVVGITLLNHRSSDNSEVDNPNFVPAKAIIQTGGTGTTVATSQITGVQYKKITGSESYTLPFGKSTTATQSFLAIAEAIRDAAAGKTPPNAVSFTPERIRSI